MKQQHFLLKDVARTLGIKPYRITYALSTGLVGEPSLRIANKRIFYEADIHRLAKHFGVDLDKKAGDKAKTEGKS
jgi:prophage antirepressor-like protein